MTFLSFRSEILSLLYFVYHIDRYFSSMVSARWDKARASAELTVKVEKHGSFRIFSWAGTAQDHQPCRYFICTILRPHTDRLLNPLHKVKPAWAIPSEFHPGLLSRDLSALIHQYRSHSGLQCHPPSLGTAALLSTYSICISCILLKGWSGEPLRPQRWSLSRWGAPINLCAVLSLLLAYFFSFWPLFTPTRALSYTVRSCSFDAGILLLPAEVRYVGPVILVRHDLGDSLFGKRAVRGPLKGSVKGGSAS